jgi:CDGSH-type Zn-finger protein
MTNTIRPHVDGPLNVEGELELLASDGTSIQKTVQAWLCRCGQSANKPFCDGAHKRAGFSGNAKVSSEYFVKNPEPGTTGPDLRLTLRANGPIGCFGQLRIAGSDGSAWQGDQANLCRCGQSGNKPFCDGSHRHSGFTAP